MWFHDPTLKFRDMYIFEKSFIKINNKRIEFVESIDIEFTKEYQEIDKYKDIETISYGPGYFIKIKRAFSDEKIFDIFKTNSHINLDLYSCDDKNDTQKIMSFEFCNLINHNIFIDGQDIVKEDIEIFIQKNNIKYCNPRMKKNQNANCKIESD